METESPYFFIKEESTITSFNELISLNKKNKFASVDYYTNSHLQEPHETTGIFRGQSQDWPLIPVAYRDLKSRTTTKFLEMDMRSDDYLRNYQFETFCKMASKQNKLFPKSPIERMCIAQHYGINTPLLDWTTNIFVAAYFALDLKDEDNQNKNLEPYIYHLKDERYLKTGIYLENDLKKINYSALVEAPPIDRRIERQFSVFSFHPHPLKKPEKIPLSKYKISGDLFYELWEIMEGIGFSSPYLFPDYAGLVDRIKKGYMI